LGLKMFSTPASGDIRLFFFLYIDRISSCYQD
jgi:hypothetical protein